MLTSHAYQSSHDHFNQGGLYHQDSADASKPLVEGGTTKIMNPSPTCGDPFAESVQSVDGTATTGVNNSPSHQFGADEEFDSMGIQIPSSALEEQHQGSGGYNNYHQHQMVHHHQQHQQQWQQHHQHQIQQQQWNQQGQYMSPNGYGHGYEQYGYGDYGQMYGQGGGGGHTHAPSQAMNSNSGSVVGMGGPSPVGSHNTPSPQGAHSDDGVLVGGSAEDHIRNNNILKRPSPGSAAPGVPGNAVGVVPGTNNMHPGVMHHAHQGVVHQMGHHHAHHHAAMASPYHLHGHSQHQIPPPGMPVAKKPKVSKRKKKRDPNEPSKPVSAYALFFRDSQASIKVANPNAAFGDVSKIVASLWDALDPDSKAAYKKRTENAKKDYLKKLAGYRASLVSKGGDSGIGYGYYGYSDVMQNNALHPSHKYMGGSGVTTPSGGGQSSSSYMGQPIPPRPPMQHVQAVTLSNAHLHHGHGTSGAYMMQGQMQNGGLMGGQSPHSQPSHGGLPHSSISQHSPMDNNSHLHNQTGGTNSIGVGGGPIHSPNGGSNSSGSSSGQTPLNTPTSASISSSSPNGCAVNKSSQQQQQQGQQPSSGAGTSHGKQCGRPGCTNLVQRSPEGWTEEFCSNECVVGQCKEVYTSWSSGSAPVSNTGAGGPPPNPYSSPTAPPVK